MVCLKSASHKVHVYHGTETIFAEHYWIHGWCYQQQNFETGVNQNMTKT